MAEQQEKLLQWHAAFFAGIQIELKDEAEHLTFENEHMLGTKPLQVDVLIIKKHTERKIKKNIGRIFRKYNIVEYKSPEDYLSIDDFYKVLAYACIYKSDTGKIDEVKIEETTVTFVCSHFPRILIKHLKKQWGICLDKQEAGIYYVHDERFPIQILVTKELSEDNNLWLRSLTNDLKERASAERLIREYEGHQKDNLYSSMMEIIVRANTERFGEVRNMCNALLELMKDDLDAREQQGISKGGLKKLEDLIQKKILKNKTLEQIAEDLETDVSEIQPIYERLKAEMV